MFKLSDILNYLGNCKGSGATFDDLKHKFDKEEKEEIKRLLEAGLLLQEIKTDGKGRGLRYYLIDSDIVKILPDAPQKNNLKNSIEGIDVSDCLTTQDKIKKIQASDIPLAGIVPFEFNQKLFDDKEYGKELYDFIHDGTKYVDVKLHNNPKNKKNEIFYKKVRETGNSVTIKYKDGEWLIVKTHCACIDRPEVKSYTSYTEFEKCLKTLFITK